ncbi:MAG: hypothetical protein AAF670_00370 [Planctomycetota bacterium]
MHTPAHIAASLFVYRGETRPLPIIAVTGGAVLPDAPMFLFYAFEKICGTSEREIWSAKYFQDDWQLFFDVFNSIPLALFVWGLGRWMGWRNMALLAGSWLLHLIFDLPLHHDDAHRHFLPFSQWRFESSVSYWDPRHFGLWVAPLEVAAAVTVLIWVTICNRSRSMRTATISTLSIYLFAIVMALSIWVSMTDSPNSRNELRTGEPNQIRLPAMTRPRSLSSRNA